MMLVQHIEESPLTAVFSSTTSWYAIYHKESTATAREGQINIFDDKANLSSFINAQNGRKGCLINLSDDPLNEYWELYSVDAIIHFTIEEGTAFDYITNPDKSIRWIFPAHVSTPVFLHLYNGNSWKANVFEKIINWSYRFSLQKLLTSRCYVQYKEGTTIAKLINGRGEFAVFTGTKGVNRKVVIAICENGKALSYLKIPLTTAARRLTSNELNVLTKLNNQPTKYISFPAVLDHQYGKDVLHMTNIKPDKYQKTNKLQHTHLEALKESYKLYAHQSLLQESKFWKEIEKQLAEPNNAVPSNGLNPIKIQSLWTSLSSLYQLFDGQIACAISMAHADFTPWNSFVSKNKLYLYDWELSEELPLLYDLFHFVFQSNILLKKSGFVGMKKDLEAIKESSILQKIVQDYNLDFEQCYCFYLLKTITYYLPKYIEQEQLHEQANWLTETWLEAVLDVLNVP